MAEKFAFERTEEFNARVREWAERLRVAALVQSAGEFVKMMGWTDTEPPVKAEGIQRSLFPELTEEEEAVVHILVRQGDLHINTLVVEADIPVNRMSALLFELEMKGVVKTLVGGVYHLLA